MSQLMVILAALFLPLFPFSMAFNALLARVRHPVLRAVLLLFWPQIGLALIYTSNPEVPQWIAPWALFTAALYGLRALVLREVGLWMSFLATSAWALLWIPILGGMSTPQVPLYALGFSAPCVLLALLTAALERRFGAAYTGLYGGLAQSLPRLSGVLVVVILAVVATPLFPAFPAMLASILVATPASAVAMAGIWLLWSWAGARLLQGLVVGPTSQHDAADLSLFVTWVYAAVLVALVVGGVYLIGELP